MKLDPKVHLQPWIHFWTTEKGDTLRMERFHKSTSHAKSWERVFMEMHDGEGRMESIPAKWLVCVHEHGRHHYMGETETCGCPLHTGENQ